MDSPVSANAAAGGQKLVTSFKTFVFVLRTIFLLLNLGMIVLNAYFLFYVHKIERDGCKCALGWRRSFLEVSLVLFVLMGIVSLVVDWEDHFMWLSALYNGLIIAYLFVTREFINDMRSQSCQCAQTKAFEVLNIVNIIALFLLAAMLFGLVLVVLFWGTVGRTAKKAVAVASSSQSIPAGAATNRPRGAKITRTIRTIRTPRAARVVRRGR
jgi:hypothetical protein